MHGLSETLCKGSIAEQMQLSAVSQRPRESTLHFPLFSFPWSGKLGEFPPRAEEPSLGVGNKNYLFSFGNYLGIMFYSTCLFYCFVTHYSLRNQSVYYYYHLLANAILIFIWIFFPSGVLAKYNLVTIKAGQIKLSKSMLGTILMCPHLSSFIWLISVFQRDRTRKV